MLTISYLVLNGILNQFDGQRDMKDKLNRKGFHIIFRIFLAFASPSSASLPTYPAGVLDPVPDAGRRYFIIGNSRIPGWKGTMVYMANVIMRPSKTSVAKSPSVSRNIYALS